MSELVTAEIPANPNSVKVIINVDPVWGTSPVVSARYGITQGKLRELARSGIVRARKENPDSRTSRTVFRCSDVNEWLENEAPRPRAEAFEPRRRRLAAALG